MSTKKDVVDDLTATLPNFLCERLGLPPGSPMQVLVSQAVDDFHYAGSSCLGKASMDEPVFILRARDPLFTETVQRWAIAARRDGLHEPDKVASAVQQAHEGGRWREEWLLAQIQKETE